MKLTTKILPILILSGLLIGCTKNQKISRNKEVDSLEKIDSSNKTFLGPGYAKLELERFLNDTTTNVLIGQVIINSKEKLIAIAEPILFDIYGRDNILKERPYEIYLFDDYWIMSGTLPKGWLGGTFSIVINRKTCEVVGVSHGK
jgi:hypothetical protein